MINELPVQLKLGLLTYFCIWRTYKYFTQ